MGIDVASFGDFFADKRLPIGRTQDVSRIDKSAPEIEISTEEPKAEIKPARSGRRHGRKEDEPINCLIYKDPFSATYKKYIFTEDGKYLLGGMMVGDVGDFVKLVAIVKKKVRPSSPLLSRDSSKFRKLSKSLRPSSLWVRRRETTTGATSMTTLRFAVVM